MYKFEYPWITTHPAMLDTTESVLQCYWLCSTDVECHVLDVCSKHPQNGFLNQGQSLLAIESEKSLFHNSSPICSMKGKSGERTMDDVSHPVVYVTLHRVWICIIILENIVVKPYKCHTITEDCCWCTKGF